MGKLSAVFLTLFISACASLDGDQSAEGFDEGKYLQHLSECYGGNVVWGKARSVGYGVLGSFAGVGQGLIHGAIWGDTPQSVLAGAAVGSVIGLGAGAYNSLDKGDEEFRYFMMDKGYIVF
jgi:hypothetical protein